MSFATLIIKVLSSQLLSELTKMLFFAGLELFAVKKIAAAGLFDGCTSCGTNC
jgi:hypothetical protein